MITTTCLQCGADGRTDQGQIFRRNLDVLRAHFQEHDGVGAGLG